MEQTWWQHALDALPPIAAVIAAGVALYGLSTWKRETRGRRQLELAEEVLADFYEAKEIMGWVRNPGSFENEGSDREPQDHEDEATKRWRDVRYVPLKRMNDKVEFFSKMYARRYRVMALFGKEAADPYDKFHKVRARVFVSAKALVFADPSDPGMSGGILQKWETDIGWATTDKDEIADEIEQITDEAEAIFRPKITDIISPA